jgi:hypothetical protein
VFGPARSAGAPVQIEGVLLPGLKEEVTRAVWIGASTKDVEAMVSTTGGQAQTASDRARDLLLDTLREAGGQMESDQLDATVAEAAGLKAKTVRNLRADLKNKGWLRAIPEKDDAGTVLRWIVALTNAAPDPSAGQSPSRARGYAGEGPWTIHAGSGDPWPPEPDCPTPPRERALGTPEPNFSSYLVDERGRFIRHPDEPKLWCLECKATATR